MSRVFHCDFDIYSVDTRNNQRPSSAPASTSLELYKRSHELITIGDEQNFLNNALTALKLNGCTVDIYTANGRTSSGINFDNFNGGEKVKTMLYHNVVFPFDNTTTHASLGAFHFSILGTEGSGKKEIVKYLCNQKRINFILVPGYAVKQETFGWLKVAASFLLPCIIYFDEALMPLFTPDFQSSKDFFTHFAQSFKNWGLLWLAFGTRVQKNELPPELKAIIGNRCETMEVTMQDKFNYFKSTLARRGYYLPPLMSDGNIKTITSALTNLQPSEVEDIVLNIIRLHIYEHKLKSLSIPEEIPYDIIERFYSTMSTSYTSGPETPSRIFDVNQSPRCSTPVYSLAKLTLNDIGDCTE